jgi:ribosomal protein S1
MAPETADAVLEVAGNVPTDEETVPIPEEPPPKPKRTRKKKTDAVDTPQEPSAAPITPKEKDTQKAEKADPAWPDSQSPAPILTVEVGGVVETEESMADLAWHEIHNAYRTRRILTGFLGGLEQTDSGKTLVVVEYKGFRVVIPLKEMVVGMPNNLSGKAYSDMVLSYNKLLSNMLGCQIDFIVKGIDSKSRSIVASRREAMLRKRRDFYFEPDDNGNCRVYPGRIIQARVILVAEKAIRIEAFGVECSIIARDLSWDWIGDARDRYSVGDHILVRIMEVNDDTIEGLTIKADAKSVSGSRQNNLSLVRIQSKYAGKVTDIHKGTVYVRLTNGVNAIAHTCYDRRTPGKKDDVSFAVTGIDEDRGVALGIITRIIRQNL